MIEPEIAYADLSDAMNCAEDYVRYCCRYLLDTCRCARSLPYHALTCAQACSCLLLMVIRRPVGH